MKKNVLFCVLVMILILLLAGCGCSHEWFAATCAAAKTCSLCGKTEGNPLPHTWQDATCTSAKTCSVCKTTEGEPLPHTWQDATCTDAKICTVCETTEGEALGHTWQNATCTVPKTCIFIPLSVIVHLYSHFSKLFDVCLCPMPTAHAGEPSSFRMGLPSASRSFIFKTS